MPGKQSKAAFVRSLRPTTPAKDVIAKAKEKGINISAAYVYVIRSKGSNGAKGRKPRSARLGRPPGSGARGAEQQFVGLALELGFGRAQDLLDSAKKRARQAIGV